MEIRRHGRHWAVYDAEGTLVTVTVYRKGAAEVMRRLTGMQANASGPRDTSSNDTASGGGPATSQTRPILPNKSGCTRKRTNSPTCSSAQAQM